MNRFLLLLVPAVFGIVSNSHAGIPGNFYRISAGKDGGVSYLGIENGELALGSRSPHLRRRKETDAYPDRWYVMGTKIKASVGGKYLAYDPTGADNKVFLTDRVEDYGTSWVIVRGKPYKGKNTKTDGEEWGVIQVASGPMKGWFLDIQETEETLSNGTTKRIQRFILTKDPVWNFEVARMYLHL